jgi:hypothetical protein
MSTISLLSPVEAAVVLDLSVQRIRQLCAAGQIGQRVGDRWVIPSDELYHFAKIPRKRGPKPRLEKSKNRR